MPREGELQRKRSERRAGDGLVHEAGFAKVIRTSKTQVQIDSAVLGRRWVRIDGIHQTSDVRKRGDMGQLRLKSGYAKEIGLVNGRSQ